MTQDNAHIWRTKLPSKKAMHDGIRLVNNMETKHQVLAMSMTVSYEILRNPSVGYDILDAHKEWSSQIDSMTLSPTDYVYSVKLEKLVVFTKPIPIESPSYVTVRQGYGTLQRYSLAAELKAYDIHVHLIKPVS